jgi:hypothetical protein
VQQAQLEVLQARLEEPQAERPVQQVMQPAGQPELRGAQPERLAMQLAAPRAVRQALPASDGKVVDRRPRACRGATLASGEACGDFVFKNQQPTRGMVPGAA